MATKPQRPAAPPEPEDKPEDKPAPAPPEPVHTIADEQRARSEAMQSQGMQAWKDEHDDRPESERSANTTQVTGVGPTQISEETAPTKSWAGSTRSTPEARKAQHPAASR